MNRLSIHQRVQVINALVEGETCLAASRSWHTAIDQGKRVGDRRAEPGLPLSELEK